MLEVTLRTKAGAEAARRISEEVPDAIVGLRHGPDAARISNSAEKLGLRFAFSPGATPGLARRRGGDRALPFVPGDADRLRDHGRLERGFTS